MKEHEIIATVNGLIRLYDKLLFAKKNDFNIFTILRNANDEVMLHSRFIYELLNPKGSHNMKQAYLLAFFETIREATGLPSIDYESLQSVSVFRELRNIDLVLFLPNEYTIVIENKIYASDQDRQLERYYNTIVGEFKRNREKVIILYLTLEGRAPSDASIGDLTHPIHKISYVTEINKWIDKCLSLSLEYKSLHEIITQYKGVILNLTGMEGEDKVLTDEIVSLLLSSKENFKSASAIKNSLPSAQTKVIQDLFVAFEREMVGQTGIEPIDLTGCAKDYYAKRSGDLCPRQLYPLKSYTKENFQFSFCFYIEIYYTLYYGFSFAAKSKDGIYENISIDEIKSNAPLIYKKCEKSVANLFDNETDRNKTDISLYWNYFYDTTGNAFNFKQFSDNCIDLYINIGQEVKRLCNEATIVIDIVKSNIIVR